MQFKDYEQILQKYKISDGYLSQFNLQSIIILWCSILTQSFNYEALIHQQLKFFHSKWWGLEVGWKMHNINLVIVCEKLYND